MASCAACTATRSALLSSSCRARNSRIISTSTGTTTASSASTIVRAPKRQKIPSSPTISCRALSTTAGMHLLPASPFLLASTTAVASSTSNTGSSAENNDNFLLASTIAVLTACSLNFVAANTSSPVINTTTTNITTTTPAPKLTTGTSSEGGGGGGSEGGGGDGGGGPSVDAAVVAPAAVSSSSSDMQKQKSDNDVKAYEDSIAKDPYQVSKSAEQGVRWTMEDTYSVANGGHFAAVFDGHGGAGVSGMLRDHVHRLYSKALTQRHHEEAHRSTLDEMQVDDDVNDNDNDEVNNNNENDNNDNNKKSIPSIQSHTAAIRGAFSRIERESLRHDHFEYQGSTAVAVIVHVGEDGNRTLISANVGDSRAILCRGKKAVDLTRDHKPSDEREKARIRSMGEDVQWDPYGEIYRVKDLSLSRAIGDRFAKPVVSSEAEIDSLPVNDDEDEFFLLASDGLWDVMTSQEVVDFVHEMLECPTQSVKTKKGKIILTPEFRRRKMARFVAHEALERGSADNVCVILVWLKKDKM